METQFASHEDHPLWDALVERIDPLDSDNNSQSQPDSSLAVGAPKGQAETSQQDHADGNTSDHECIKVFNPKRMELPAASGLEFVEVSNPSGTDVFAQSGPKADDEETDYGEPDANILVLESIGLGSQTSGYERNDRYRHCIFGLPAVNNLRQLRVRPRLRRMLIQRRLVRQTSEILHISSVKTS